MALGALGKLTVTLSQYHPRVQCSSPTRPSGSLNATTCQMLLDAMLTTTSSQIFGQRGAPGVEVPLAIRLASRMLTIHRILGIFKILTASAASGDCSIAILMDGPPMLMTWHEVWGAAVAVAGMCVEEGRIGIATLQCRPRKVSMSVDSRADSLISHEFQD